MGITNGVMMGCWNSGRAIPAQAMLGNASSCREAWGKLGRWWQSSVQKAHGFGDGGEELPRRVCLIAGQQTELLLR